jgi:hypothetical protein
MHILPAFYTTNNTRKRKRKTEKKISAHDIWLLNKGLHPDQIRGKKTVDLSWKKRYNDDMMVDRSTKEYDSKQLVAGDCSKRDIMTNLHKEPKHVQDAILEKASRVMPLYNKGGLQLLSPKDDLTQIGTKSRRG